MRFFALSLCLAIFAAGAGHPGNAADVLSTLSSADIFELEYASDPQISADGKTIAYVRRSHDIMTDRTRSNIWTVDADTGAHRPLLSGRKSYYAPRWSADGERLAYLSSAEGSVQLYIRWMATGDTALVTNLAERPAGISWSPDGKWIAFSMPVKRKDKKMVKAPKKPKGAKWAPAVKVIDKPTYRFNGVGYLETAYRHIFLVPSEGGSARQLSKGDFNYTAVRYFSSGPIAWTTDSSAVIVSSNQHENWERETMEQDLFQIDIATGQMTQLTDEPGVEASPRVSPDGSKIAYIKVVDPGISFRTADLAVADRDGRNPVLLTSDFDRSISAVHWAKDGRKLFASYVDRSYNTLAAIDLKGSRDIITRDLGGTTLGRPYTSGSFTVGAGDRVAYTHGTAKRPADVGLMAGKKHRVLTGLNEDLLGHRQLGDVHEITFKSSFDGAGMQGWYVTPPGFEADKTYPLVLEIHGGPALAYGPQFTAEIQRYAAEGYVVLYVNHRGSLGYGQDFGMLLHHAYPGQGDFEDHMSGIDALIARGIVDPERLYITGGSAGGVASAYAVGLTDRFKAAVSAKPIINWTSKTMTGDSYLYQVKHQFPGTPWEYFDHYWKRSPLSLTGSVVTPTMLITGEQDFRTPISETEQFYQALQYKGVDTAMVRVPGASHGIAARPSHMIAKIDHVLAWFKKYGGTGPENAKGTVQETP